MDNEPQQQLQTQDQPQTIPQPVMETSTPSPTTNIQQSGNIKKGLGKKWLLIPFLLIFVALISGFTVFYYLNITNNKQIACTTDAKICPDGKTAVGRVAPNCEFAECPKNDEKPTPGITAIPAPIYEDLTGDCIVVGCGKELCLNKGDDAPTYQSCDNLPIYACFKSAKCEKQQNGKCDWTQTQELKTCLNNTK